MVYAIFFQKWLVQMVDENVGVPVSCYYRNVVEDEGSKVDVKFKNKEEGSFKISDYCK